MQIPFVVHVVEPRISGTFHLAAAPDAITKAIAMECEGRVFITDPIGDTFVRTEFSELTDGGRGGIRTHGTLAGTPVFKTGALNHSATLPWLRLQSPNGPKLKNG
jgi:hypothetical protein